MARMSVWKTLFVFVMLLGLAAAESPANVIKRNPEEYFFQESFGDFPEELETAKQDGKHGVMLFFEEEDCPFCEWMRQKVINQPRVQDWYRKHFRLFSIDIRGDNELRDFDGEAKSSKALASRYNRRELTPVMAFFGLDGELTYRKFGVVRTAEEFLWLGEFVVNGHYKRTKFTRFKREKLKSGKAAGTSPQ